MAVLAILVVVVALLYFQPWNPYQAKAYREIGYSDEEIAFILKQDNSFKEAVLEQDYQEYLIERNSNPEFSQLWDKHYTKTEIDEILSLDEPYKQFLLGRDKIDDYQQWFNHERFILANYDRYRAYEEKHAAGLDVTLTKVNTNRDMPYYQDVQAADHSLGNLLLVNKYYALEADYVPDNLTSIGSCGTGKLVKEARDAFAELCEAAKNDGYSIQGISAYRSYLTQDNLYKRYVSENGQAAADRFSARAGHSEHQTGLAIDVASGNPSITAFGSTPAFKWMKEHAHEYGFILRYPAEREDETGYKYEPWHYRYLGKEMAEKVVESGLTYDEYVQLYLLQEEGD